MATMDGITSAPRFTPFFLSLSIIYHTHPYSIIFHGITLAIWYALTCPILSLTHSLLLFTSLFTNTLSLIMHFPIIHFLSWLKKQMASMVFFNMICNEKSDTNIWSGLTNVWLQRCISTHLIGHIAAWLRCHFSCTHLERERSWNYPSSSSSRYWIDAGHRDHKIQSN